MQTRLKGGLLALAFALASAGCGGGSEETASAVADRSAAPAPAGPAAAPPGGPGGMIRGVVRLIGPAPAPVEVSMAADPYCKEQHGSAVIAESVVRNPDGTLRNVFVYVKDGPPIGRSYAPPAEPAVLDQLACRYDPHVLGLMVGQPLTIRNSDGTLHNVHAVARNNRRFNIGMPNRGMQVSKQFMAPEVMVRIKCDVHPWMESWIGVLPHPFFAVTGDGGAFAIGDLPPGAYTIEAWHETFGTEIRAATVEDGTTVELSFEFKAAT